MANGSVARVRTEQPEEGEGPGAPGATATAAAPGRRLASRALLNLLLGLLSFVAVAGAIRPLVPHPWRGALREKLSYLAQHPDRYDVLIVGSSNVYRSLVPDVIDEELARAGLPWRTFNLGVQGMRAFERDYVLDRVLELGSRRLRWLVVELDSWRPIIVGDPYTHRAVHWHDGRRTAQALAAVARSRLPSHDKLAWALTHLKLAGMRLASLGLGPTAVEALTHPTLGDMRTPEQIAVERGFLALDDEPGSPAERTPIEDVDPEELEELFEQAAKPLAREVPDVFITGPIRRQVDAIRRAGLDLVFLAPPKAGPNLGLSVRLALSDPPPMLFFNSPDEYPELFEFENRFDAAHLNRRGAELFSRLFARRFVAEIEKAGDELPGSGAPAGGDGASR